MLEAPPSAIDKLYGGRSTSKEDQGLTLETTIELEQGELKGGSGSDRRADPVASFLQVLHVHGVLNARANRVVNEGHRIFRMFVVLRFFTPTVLSERGRSPLLRRKTERKSREYSIYCGRSSALRARQ